MNNPGTMTINVALNTAGLAQELRDLADKIDPPLRPAEGTITAAVAFDRAKAGVLREAVRYHANRFMGMRNPADADTHKIKCDFDQAVEVYRRAAGMSGVSANTDATT